MFIPGVGEMMTHLKGQISSETWYSNQKSQTQFKLENLYNIQTHPSPIIILLEAISTKDNVDSRAN